jgi:hypothetical protein
MIASTSADRCVAMLPVPFGRVIFERLLICGLTAVRTFDEGSSVLYALDSTTVDLCLSLFSWTPFRATKAALRPHTLLDLRGNIPSVVHITDGRLHNINILDQLLPETGAFTSWIGLYRFPALGRAFAMPQLLCHPRQSPMRLRLLPSHRPRLCLICDHTVALMVRSSRKNFPAPLRRIPLSRSAIGQAPDSSYQQLHRAGADHHPAL